MEKVNLLYYVMVTFFADIVSRKECPKFIQKLCGQKQGTVYTGTIADMKDTSMRVLVTNSGKGMLL